MMMFFFPLKDTLNKLSSDRERERERELQHFECSLLHLLRLTERDKNNPQRKQDLACSLRFPSQHSCGVGDLKPNRV
jgi:hypothetical protein